MLQRMQDRGQRVELRLKMKSERLPDATSRNVVGEILGREQTNEIVLVSGHIDSWDVGQGAMDDGGGCLVAWETIRLMKKLGFRPRRTVRVVLWTGEENGLWGAKAYRLRHAGQLSDHVLAIESDRGPFQPKGFAFTGSSKAMPYLQSIARFLDPIGAGELTSGTGGMDVLELRQAGVPAMDLVVDREKYFWFHHSEADTVDKLDPRELNSCIGAVATMAYVVADMPDRLPR